MNQIIQDLLKLQSLEFDTAVTDKAADATIANLRSHIPAPILGHYDRLAERGKKGVAIVRNQACTGCHMRLPIGTINTLMHGNDLQLCDTCGRYLCLPDPAQEQAAQSAPAPARKPRKRKQAAHAL